MLRTLTIQNYALIDKLDISFEKGFTTITGETGAGKSIMLGAIGLLLGQRADIRSIKAGASRCTVEATFETASYNLQDFFRCHGDGHAAMRCILDGVREQLLQQKQHPFFIRQNRHGNGFVDEPDFPQNKLRCIFSDGLPDDAI